ncbi:uncharacterized protein Z519_06120 [Cladophialophora bantiana CBS 173.52]|uniref:Small-subunit processome Utp12 domain-containing protein n=1 Tax=Cladophialophora bantiana (strain ATCC 10958 / CBS 173.52 / CDC B-1940 / NIH 8579) TaxID=1442370 RepID=A0A0D2HRS9_CLAB1|nr:uncharacterized protein Z519_06120 [Cladophialophora bantiana CBS 173.52]KIW93515.1 hypothetical protein Z519_06120 [Cladophialophora bantiana CBS 173.52]
MGRKDPQNLVSKISSASSPAVGAGVNTQKSSVLRSAFAPSQLQLHLFASVIQSFDGHQLRIHDTTTGRLRSQHETRAGSKISCLDWGYYGAAYRERQQSASKKKRKRDQENNDGVVVAYGTNTSQICMFSPAEGRIVGTLNGGHERGVKDFKFSCADYLHGWSIGEEAKLLQWDLTKDQPIRTINLPDPAISILASPSQELPQILCASSTPFAIEITSSDDFRIGRFDSFKNPIHSLCRSGSEVSGASEYFLAADPERYINVYDISQKKLVRTLVAGSGVVSLDLATPTDETAEFLRQQVLSVVTREGSVELFPKPFTDIQQINGDLKSSRKNLTRKASASIRLVRPESKAKYVPIFAAFLQGSHVVVVSADGGVDLTFQKVRWQDEGNGELLFDGVKEVVKARSSSTLNTATLNGVKDLGKTHVDESRTVVVNGGAGGAPLANAIEISDSDNDEEVDEDEGDESADETANRTKGEGAKEDDEEASDENSDEEMADAEKAEDAAAMGEAAADFEGERGEPSFGELLASKHPHEISIASALPQRDISTLTLKPNQTTIPSGMSLSTVLTQALRTNDTTLLEACLHTFDMAIVKSTIQRLDSTLAGLLLSKLAERLASRPGRYGHLITWVQWTCICHGGAIASQPGVARKVRTLYEVLNARMRTLDDLLLLKGKLDMLDAQLDYRKQLLAQRPQGSRKGRDEPGIIYIEGQDNWDSDDEDLDEEIARPSKKPRTKQQRDLGELIGNDEEDEDDEDLMPLPNGADDVSSDNDEDEDDEPTLNGIGKAHARGLVDDEAEVSIAEESDPDDGGPSPAGSDTSSVASSDNEDASSSLGEESDDGEEEEDDSEMDSFINDGSVDFEEEVGDEVRVPGDSSDDDEEPGNEDQDEEPGNEDQDEEPETEPAPKKTPVAKKRKGKDKDKDRVKARGRLPLVKDEDQDDESDDDDMHID